MLASPESFFFNVGTVPDLLARRVELTPESPAFVHQRLTRWQPVSWNEFERRSVAVAGDLTRRGLTAGCRIAILAPTSVEWEVAQMAALRCGATVVGLDTYYPDALLTELIEKLDVDALVVHDAATLERIAPTTLSRLRFSIDRSSFDEAGNAPAAANAVQSRALAEAPAFITFSSGSTGRPQPIVYTHAQIVHAVRCILEAYPELAADTRLVTWLPLANLFQRMIDLCAIAKGATSYVVSDPRTVMDVLPVANPHVLIAVPRFCERVHSAIAQRLEQRPTLARVVDRAIRLAAEARPGSEMKAKPRLIKRVALVLADRLILGRLRAAFGRHLRFIVTGSAPMPRWLLDWYAALGIPVLEAYGASENLVPIAANRLGSARVGTVGKPLGDNAVRIAETGEVQVRGRGVFHPDLAENAHRRGAITDDGFLATGDLGSIDAEGFLTLLGRESEVFKNTQGRWISLPLIEATLRRVPGIEHLAIVRVDSAGMVGVMTLSHREELDRDPQARSVLERRLREAVRELPGAMQPIGFVVMRHAFSPLTGELTTNLKLRRSVVAQRLVDATSAVEDLMNAYRGATGGVAFRYL